ncbi:DUF6541 family protein [Bifidobacterium sp. ESL0790]|uniref:DUF6541 family protein n=1 Tax=Bifidobacterium sp. ESL0790 TaxID=2983233 RepID=UPI0023FA165D|nr:DUF6541 family protein [Bifidobacterium sp. ESL0790]WEV72571.1 hypothetical protein OZY47_00860 [Bifidobacterium sp. ESL0790]
MKRTWKRRLRALALPLSAVVGVLAAFGIVVAWFPNASGAWSLPLQQIDAPAHYYFIRKILREGVGAATRLWPNDAYYPPMFHLLAAGIIAAGRAIGVNVSIYAAFNIVWLATSGLVWPTGMSLLASYWTRKVDGRAGEAGRSKVGGRGRNGGHLKGGERDDRAEKAGSSESRVATESDGSSEAATSLTSWRPFSCCMMIIVPILAVSSASHPFYMLASGPLISFGLATTLLPYWLYVTLRLFDAIASRHHVGRWLIATILLGALCVFAHPRIAFTWLLLMAPFMLMRLPWKLIVAALAAVVVCAVSFFFYMIGHYHSTRYFDPSSWFHTYKPNRTVPEALRVFVTDNIGGFAGVLMAIVVIVALLVAIVVAVKPRLAAGLQDNADNQESQNGRDDDNDSRREPQWLACDIRNDAISLILAFLLVALVYICSTSLTGWFPNIVAAAWYRAETRPLTMIPFAIIPLLVFVACVVARVDPVIIKDFAGSVSKQSAKDPALSTSSSDSPNHVSVSAHTEEDADGSTPLPEAIPPRASSESQQGGESVLLASPLRVSHVSASSQGITDKGAGREVSPSDSTHLESTTSQRIFEAGAGGDNVKPVARNSNRSAFARKLSRSGGKVVVVVVLAALALACQFGNANRSGLSDDIAHNMTLTGKPYDEQLTAAKYQVLQQTVAITGTDALIISDPLNGSMYGSAAFGANMLFPVYNPMHEKNGAIFGQTELAFGSGDQRQLDATTCPIDGGVPKYFLAMGPQAPSLKMFSFRQQYDVFHRQDLIDAYERQGALTKVKDFSSAAPQAKDWALYRINCGRA